jgi:RimJ/RimL family protein N-acetyltransferase
VADEMCYTAAAMVPAHYRENAIPIIDTARLTLRGHRPEDFGDSVAMWGDPEVARYITGKPSSREEVWSRFLRYAGHWSVMGFGFWMIQEATSGRFVGEVGFMDFKREIQPSFDGVPETGWVLARWARRKGFATEAVRAALKWGATHFKSERTVCLINPENLASIRVAEKCGYRESARTTYKGQTTIVFER